MKYLIRYFLRVIPRHQLHRIAHIFLTIVSPFYRGNRYEDPITGIRYRKLLPYGRRGRTRKNALAPDSMSLERHRLLWIYLRERTNFFTDRIKFLHIAPEYCYLRRFKKLKNLEYVTGDLNSPWADVKMDVHDIPFDDDSFDVIMGNHLLEHVEDDLAVMKEFYRVMKPGGWGIFQVPLDRKREETLQDPNIRTPEERERVYWQSDHMRLYGLDFPVRLESAGFEVVRDQFVRELDPELVRRYALPARETIYLCKKPVQG